MRKLLALVIVSATSAALALPALAATKSVDVGDNWFVRSRGVPTVTVKRNDTVRWRFVGDRPHNVVATRGPVRFRSPVKSSGVFKRKMTRGGTYRIVCEIHGRSDQSMVLKVR
ncbi:MAG TPA: hypothetical protein VM299_03095 [Solirubrobacteraceae bacterium]|nr:hypothetical protein [Solirubrobacteraceae bacterium]